MTHNRKIKLLKEVIKKSHCISKYVFEIQEKIHLGNYNGRNAIFNDSTFLCDVSDDFFVYNDDKDKLKNILDQYMEFDSDELLLCGDLIQIFGGAIRDAIGGNPINDIDVLCTSLSRIKLDALLIERGYKLIEETYKKSLQNMYKDIKIISEPKTYINSNKKIIQLIFPVNLTTYEYSFENLISNVDISCCGLSYDGVDVMEYVPGAYIDAVEKTFHVCPDHKMYSQSRCEMRVQKFQNRGYVNIIDTMRARVNRIENIIKDSVDDVLYIQVKGMFEKAIND